MELAVTCHRIFLVPGLICHLDLRWLRHPGYGSLWPSGAAALQL